jgi:hypothetical protein
MRQQRVQVREPAMFTISWMSKIFQDCYALTMLHNLQCKEYKHGTQKPRNSKTIPPLQIMDGCGNRLLFTLPFTHLWDHVPDSVSNENSLPKRSTTVTKTKTQAEPRKQNCSLQISTGQVTTSVSVVFLPFKIATSKAPRAPQIPPLAPWPALADLPQQLFLRVFALGSRIVKCDFPDVK